MVHRHHLGIFCLGGADPDSVNLKPKNLRILNDQNTGIRESFLTKGDSESVEM